MKSKSIVLMCLIGLCFVWSASPVLAQDPPTNWQRATGFPINVVVNDIQLFGSKFYAATNRGVYYRGLLHTEAWRRMPITPHNHASLAFVDLFINPQNQNELFCLFTSSNSSTGSRIWTVKKNDPDKILRGISTVPVPNLGMLGHSYGSDVGRFALPSSGGTQLYSYTQSKLKRIGNYVTSSAGYINGTFDPSRTVYRRRAARSPKSAYAVIKSERGFSKPSILIGCDGFVLRDEYGDPNSAWTYIEKGFQANCGLITTMIGGQNTKTVYAGTNKGKLYKSMNGGSSWMVYNQGLLVAASDIYSIIGFQKHLYVATDKGVFVTERSGYKANWRGYGRLPNGAKATKVMVTINELIVSTDKGVYRKRLLKGGRG